MGRTLFGIDLDESPLGGVVERLLDEEDLRKLDAVPDGGTSADGGSSATDDAASGEFEETPSPGVDDDSRERLLEEYADDAGEDEDEDDDGGRLAGVRSRLRPVALALAGLAVVALVAAVILWRYGDRIAGAVPGPLGSDEVDDRSQTDEFDSATGFGPDAADDTASDEPADSDGADTEREPDAEPAVDASADSEGELGALVGLAFLAVVAVAVRKLTEEREHDPLVDGDDGDG
jgi:hypothetical protein